MKHTENFLTDGKNVSLVQPSEEDIDWFRTDIEDFTYDTEILLSALAYKTKLTLPIDYYIEDGIIYLNEKDAGYPQKRAS